MMRNLIYIVVFFICLTGFSQSKISAPSTTTVDSILVFTPQKSVKHVPYTTLLSKLETDLAVGGTALTTTINPYLTLTSINVEAQIQELKDEVDALSLGAGAVTSVNGQAGTVVLDADDIDDTATVNKFVTAAEKTLISTAIQTAHPTLLSQFTNDSGYVITETDPVYSAWDKDYADLINKPAIPVTGVDFDPVGTDNSDNNAVNTLYSGLAASKQDNISLTTTGTGGAAIFIGNTLNIPQYTGGDVFKVGTPVNNQIGVWTGDGTLKGHSKINIEDAASYTQILLGDFQTNAGYLSLYGDSGTNGASISLFNGVTENTGASFWEIEANGDFTIQHQGNNTSVPIGINKTTLNPYLGNYNFDYDQVVGAGQDNYVMTYDNGTGLVTLEASAGGGGSTTFTALTDTPSTFTGQGGLVAKVNTGETALEFADAFDVYSDSPISPIFWAGTQAQHDAKFGSPAYVHPDTDFIIITDGTSPSLTASDITNVPTGNLVATNVQTALDELQTEMDGFVGGSESTTVTDTAEIDLTLTGSAISGALIAGSIDETKLDASTNASLDLADSALQSYTETQTLQAVTDLGTTTSNSMTISSTGASGLNVVDTVGFKNANVFPNDVSAGTTSYRIGLLDTGTSVPGLRYTNLTKTTTLLSNPSADGITVTLPSSTGTIALTSQLATAGTDDQTAVEVPITDAGTLITATDVEGALQENRTAINLNTAKTPFPGFSTVSADYGLTTTDDLTEGVTNLYADANATNQGNTFNGISQLVQTDGTGRLPALDGSLLTNLPATIDATAIHTDIANEFSVLTFKSSPVNNDILLIEDSAGTAKKQISVGSLPVSTKQQTALNLKANLISPSFTTPSLGVATATSVNGVALTTGGSATNFLNEQGNYVAASGGSGDDVSTFAEKSGALIGTDRLVGLSGATDFNETISGIPLSIFNNDLSISLTTGVTGTLPVANGGTGLTDLSTLLNSNITTTTLGLQNVTNESKATMFTSPTFTGTPIIPSTFTIGASPFIRSGAHSLTLTTTAATNITLPLSGTVYSTGTTDVSVADGGTGRSTGTTAYSLVATGTTATGAQQTLANGATTTILVGGGASALPVWTTATGSGAPVRATSPTLVTPILGAATATTINGATITSGTLNGSVTGTNTGDDTSEVIQIACSGLTTDLATGTSKAYFRMPYAATINSVRASVLTAPTGSILIVDINEAGATVMTTNKLSIDASETTSTTAATAATLTDTSLADDAEITIDIDQIGSTVAGAGLIVTLKLTRL